MRALDRNRDVGIFRLNKSSAISVPCFGTKNAFTTELQSIEISEVRLFCLLRKFMNINEASKMATHDLAQRNLRRFPATLSETSEVLSYAGVLSFPKVCWCITCGINVTDTQSQVECFREQLHTV